MAFFNYFARTNLLAVCDITHWLCVHQMVNRTLLSVHTFEFNTFAHRRKSDIFKFRMWRTKNEKKNCNLISFYLKCGTFDNIKWHLVSSFIVQLRNHLEKVRCWSISKSLRFWLQTGENSFTEFFKGFVRILWKKFQVFSFSDWRL